MSQEMPSVEVPIHGMHCANCALGVEKHLKSLGLLDARVSIATESAFVHPTEEIPLARIKQEIQSLGYSLPTGHPSHSEHTHGSESSDSFLQSGWAVIIAAIFTAPFLVHMLVHVPILHEPLVQAICALVACSIGLARFVPSAIGSLRARVPNMEVLISIGIFASLGYSVYGWMIGEAESFAFFESAATISTLVLIGGWLEQRVSNRARSAITELAKLQPPQAVKVTGNTRETVPTASLQKGDIVAVNTGDQFPCDGVVIEGTCLIDESIATGEAELQRRVMGSAVIAGTFVKQGSVLVEISKPEADSFIASMVKLVKRAQSEKPPIARTADRIAAVFVPIILGLSFITLVGGLLWGLTVAEAITRAVAVLVIACPCALGLATPAAVMIGIGRAARNNVLFRSGVSVEALANIDAIAFDKTGTLTNKEISVEVIPADGRISERELQGLAKALESHSSHPIGKQLVEKYAEIPAIEIHDAHEEIGVGVHARAPDGAAVFVGRSPRYPDRTVITHNGAVVGELAVKETLRSGATQALEYFLARSFPTLVVSGDTQKRAEALNLIAGVTIVGGQSPRQKQQTIAAQKRRTAFVGDGVNDAPVLASAAVGISLGEASSVAVNTADVVIIGSSLAPLITAHRLAAATLVTIKQNLFWAFSYNIVAIPVAMAGLLSPSWAALAMGFSDVILVINSMRLQFMPLGNPLSPRAKE